MDQTQAKLLFDPQEFLLTANGGRTISTYAPNALIYEQGNPADSVFYLQSGTAKISVISDRGAGAVIAMIKTADFFGESCLSGQELRLSTATARSECIITRLSKASIVKIIHEEPAFAELFIAHLLARSARVEDDLIDQLFNSSEKRLARTLLLLANFGNDTEPQPVLANISQETLAEMVGTTRSRVSSFMNKFRRLGFISYNGKIEVHRSLLNMVLHEQPEIKDRNQAG